MKNGFPLRGVHGFLLAEKSDNFLDLADVLAGVVCPDEMPSSTARNEQILSGSEVLTN
jgi:hypothetical protein